MSETLEHAISEALYGEGSWPPESNFGAMGWTHRMDVERVAEAVRRWLPEGAEALYRAGWLAGNRHARDYGEFV